MNAETEIQGRRQVLLIDLDNCPKDLVQLESTTDYYELIIACHGSIEPRVPLGIVPVLGRLLNEGRVQVIKMPPGRNAADFGITFWAGRLSGQLGDNVAFHIASQDKDLDFAIHSLRKCGYEARRFSNSELALISSYIDNGAATADDLRSLCKVITDKSGVPTTRSSLVTFAANSAPRKLNWLAALSVLETENLVQYADNGKVIYRVNEILSYVKTDIGDQEENTKNTASPTKTETQLDDADVGRIAGEDGTAKLKPK